eukprot:jgi/Mesvir1/8391/Mv12636-RA.1
MELPDEEDAEHVLLEIPQEVVGADDLTKFGNATLIDLDTEEPKLILDKLTLVGRYEDVVGTLMVFQKGDLHNSTNRDAGSGANASTSHDRTGQQRAPPGSGRSETVSAAASAPGVAATAAPSSAASPGHQDRLSYLCKTRKRIRFTL